MERPEPVRFVAGQKELNIGKIESEYRLLRYEDTTLTLTHNLDPGIGGINDMCYLASGLLVVVGFGRGFVVYNEDGLETEHHLSQVHGENRNLLGVCTDNRDGRVYIIENRGYLHRHTPRGHQWTHDTNKKNK